MNFWLRRETKGRSRLHVQLQIEPTIATGPFPQLMSPDEATALLAWDLKSSHGVQVWSGCWDEPDCGSWYTSGGLLNLCDQFRLSIACARSLLCLNRLRLISEFPTVELTVARVSAEHISALALVRCYDSGLQQTFSFHWVHSVFSEGEQKKRGFCCRQSHVSSLLPQL